METNFIAERLTPSLIRIVISGPRKKTETYRKIVIKPFEKNNTLFFQFERFTATQAFHENLTTEMAVNQIMSLIENNNYRQIEGFSTTEEWHAIFSKKGKSTLRTKAANNVAPVALSHNREKSYILKEGKPIPYLVQLGVMNSDGQVVKKRYDKFRQVNRFLEMVDDVVDTLPTNKPLRVIDFGCGRSYLTFALYHYLREMKQLDVTIEGLDLKEKVISDCNQLAKECQYDHLSFHHGDIVDYTSKDSIDMVVTLHACDTATDLALKKAVGWNARIILSVPCCQHELNQQIDCEPLADILQYGIIKERMSALFTDAIRANWLKLQNYDVQIMEFIDVAHTPKNLLIRGIKNPQSSHSSTSSDGPIDYSALEAMQSYLGSDLTIVKD